MKAQAEKSRLQERREEKVLAPEKLVAELMKAHRRLENAVKETPKAGKKGK